MRWRTNRPAGRADAEERDQHTEPGVGRVQDVVHEHDAEREERAETERDRERRRHHRTHQRDPERVEEAGVGLRRRPSLCVVPSWVSFAMQKNETTNVERVDEEHERVRTMVDLEGKRGHRREQRGADRDAAVRRAEDEPVGERELVVTGDEIGDRRVTRGEEDDARDLDEEAPQVDPPEGADERNQRDHHRARRVHGEHGAATVPTQRPPRAASGPPIAAGSSRSVRMPPTAIGELVSWSTSAMSATVPIQSPSDDTP